MFHLERHFPSTCQCNQCHPELCPELLLRGTTVLLLRHQLEFDNNKEYHLGTPSIATGRIFFVFFSAFSSCHSPFFFTTNHKKWQGRKNKPCPSWLQLPTIPTRMQGTLRPIYIGLP